MNKKGQEILNKAIRNGLNALFLEPSIEERLPERNLSGDEAFAFVCTPQDSAIKNISDQDLALWRPDGYSVKRSFIKPKEGIFDILIDCGTALQRTPILRIYQGKGSLLLCSMPVVSRYNKEPAATFITRELIQSLNVTPKKPTTQLVIGKNTSQTTKEACNNLGIPFSEGTPNKLYWLNGSNLNNAELKLINQCCKNGGTVLIDAIDPDTAEKLSKLTEEKIILEKTLATSLIKNNNAMPLMAGISNDDLYWRQKQDFAKEAAYRISGKKYISKNIPMIDYAIKAKGKIETPVSPGGIGIMPYQKGRIILLTIKWKDFLKIRQTRVSRLMVSLLHNLGAVSGKDRSDLKEYHYADMKTFMNREFWQKDDNTTAWFGKGKDDMRYFPVNRPGLDPVLKLPQPPEAFPEAPLTFAGINFKLVDPDKNKGKGCLLLKQNEKVTLPIESVIGKLWMLGALGSHDGKGKVAATITFNYTDNSSSVTKIKAGIHVNGFQYPTDMDKGIIAWTGNNPVRDDNIIWCWDIENPKPERKIKSLTIKAIGKKSLALIGITVEK